MASQLQLVERVQSEAGWTSKDVRAAKSLLERMLEHESLKDVSVINPMNHEIDPITYTLAYIGTEAIQNSSYSMMQEANDFPDYRGVLELKLELKESRFRFEITDNGLGVDRSFEGDLFQSKIKVHKKRLSWLFESYGTFLSDVANLLRHMNGAFGYKNTKEGVTFWYEIPLYQT